MSGSPYKTGGTTGGGNRRISSAMLSSKVVVDLDQVRVDFTELPPERLLCSLCSQVYRDPYSTSCCDKTYCRGCIEKNVGKNCPSCEETGWTLAANEEYQRQVNELYVRCLHVTDGCLWFGHLEQLPRHLEDAGGCVFVKLDCPHKCKRKFARKLLDDHVTTRCPKRPYQCEYCKGVEGTFEEVSTGHFPSCSQYPVPCPNKCPDKMVPRSQLEDHIANTCQYQNNIPCTFEFAGCQAKLQRKDIRSHLEKDIANHLMMMCAQFLRHKDQVEEKLQLLPSIIAEISSSNVPTNNQIDGDIEELLKAKDAEIRRLNMELNDVRRKKDDQDKVIDKLRHSLQLQESRLSLAEQQNISITHSIGVLRNFLPQPLPITFTINKFEQLRQSSKWWYSRPFFSSISGYKLGMFVFCNGVLDGKGTHLSVFLYLVRGEYDDELEWPFRASVAIHLLNQRGDRKHYQKVIRFTDETPPAVCNRVIDTEMAKEGNGPTQFISHGDLSYNQEKDTEYVRDDCLKIKVSSISIKSASCMTPLSPTANEHTGTLTRNGFRDTRAPLITAQSQSVDSNADDTMNGRSHTPLSPNNY